MPSRSQHVRRGVPGMGNGLGAFSPAQLAGLAAWYRADQGITIVTGVSQWNDLSGNARHLTQATGGAQPTFLATDAGGKPSVQFDGVDDVLARSNVAVITSDYSMFVAVKLDNATDGGCWAGNSREDRGLCFRTLAGGNMCISHPNVADGTDSAASTTGYHIQEAVFTSGSAVVFRYDGAAQSLTTAPTTLVTNDANSALSLGARWNQTGGVFNLPSHVRIAEVAIYSRQLSTSEASLVRKYMGARIGVAVT